jgi:thiosulfate dehydrogenase
MRSMHGVRPPNGSKPAVAITAYLTWLSAGEPLRQNAAAPLGPRSYKKLPADPAQVDVARGAQVYAKRCAGCHGEDGQGVPPVWGPRSYNAGAGLAEVPKLAGWLAVAMPPDERLSEVDAVDVAAFVNTHPRPEFVLKDHLPGPKGGVYNSEVLDEVVRAPTWPPPGAKR